MHNKTSVFKIFLFLVAAAVFAGGRKDNESHKVGNPAGFTESVDISGKKTGKWNIYLEAHDKGGNAAIAGPHNLYIDPESDLPVVMIINPQSDMHVQGNLNMVGTCLDDDGVSYVELNVTRGRDGKGELVHQGRAEGREFWSFFLDTSDTAKWPDGVYTVTACGVDINGLSGISENFPAKAHKKHQIIWNLDRKKPEIKVTSHENGALVSGKVNIRGTVWDGNGITSLQYNIGENAAWQPVGLKYNKKAGIYDYTLSLDTRAFEDGPAIVNFRSRDTMRSEGFLSFLVFSNNTGPEVQILYPEPEEAVNGLFTAAGYAKHSVGLASLSYKLGKQSGEIPLITGNPWWVKQFDIRGENTKSMDLEIYAVDLSGNTTVTKRKLVVDQDAGKPKITLTSPIAGGVVSADGLPLIGLATDNDGVKSIFYSLDGGVPVEVPCSGYFQLMIKDIIPGSHTLEIWALDITDVSGPKVQVKNIIVPGSAPEPKFILTRTGTRGAAVSDFYSGMEINNEQGASSIDLRITSGSPIRDLVYRIGERAPLSISARGGKGGENIQSIPIPGDMESGQTRFVVTVTDTYGREAVYEDYAIIIGPGGDRGYSNSSFNWVGANTSIGGGRILLSTKDPLIGVYGGGAVNSVSASGQGAEYLDFRVDEYGRVVVLGSVDGNYGPIQLNIQGASGGRFTTPGYSFLVDSTAPALDLLDNPDGRWVQNKFQVRLRVSDDNPLKAVEMSADLGVNWHPLVQESELSRLDSYSVIERTLDISALADGAVIISLRAVDEANKITEKSFSVNKDTSAPEVRLVVPVSGARVNGTIRLGMAIKEAGRLSSVTYERPELTASLYTEDGEILNVIPGITRQVYSGSSNGSSPYNFLDVVLDADTMPLAETMRFTFTDSAGNSSVLDKWPFTIDQQMDLPVLQISLPLENEVITSDFVVSGVCYDDDRISRVYWRMDNGYEQVIDAKSGYSINIPLSSMTDNEHTVTIYAEDIYGVKGPPVKRNFRVSLKEPIASLSLPTAEDIVGGTVKITGLALDDNGIDRVQVSLDNGNSYNDAEGGERWTYSFNSRIIPDGNHAVFVRALDKCGATAIYSFLINIDNSAPELSIDTPKDGAITTGPLYVTGQVMDNMKLESFFLKISSLEAVEIPAELAEKKAKLDSLILEDLDLSLLPDGSYNIEIWAMDKAENYSRISRNIILAKEEQQNHVEILYPLNGEYVQGNFNLYGMAGGIDMAGQVTLVINGIDVKTEYVTEAGFFRFAVGPEDILQGSNRIIVRSYFGGRETVQSEPKTINYQAAGPWVTVDTLNMGDFAHERPWLLGRAGYVLSPADVELLADKKTDKNAKADLLEKNVSLVELSFNNGRTFFKAGKPKGRDQRGYDWRYRLETQDMTEGLHYLIVRASMANGEKAVSRVLIQIDHTPPTIRLISPESGGHYNENLTYAALAADDVELGDMTYHLRQGDKARYEIPGFIRGLYFEGALPPFMKMIWNNSPNVFASSTFFNVGLGLSFFDDNVKLQVQYGLMTQSMYESLGEKNPVRYGGHVLGFKLLANIYTLPFALFGGLDWEWLSASFALGANFSIFNLLEEENPNYPGKYYSQSKKRTWMSAILAQIEFPRVTIPNRSYLRTFSMYTEGQLWFVPTDINVVNNKIATIIPHIVWGIRMYIF